MLLTLGLGLDSAPPAQEEGMQLVPPQLSHLPSPPLPSLGARPQRKRFGTARFRRSTFQTKPIFFFSLEWSRCLEVIVTEMKRITVFITLL